MIGQKLIKILQSLDNEEFRRLKRALSSPYFATNTRLLTLYEHLKKHYPEFKEEKLQKEKLFKKLYPGKPFNDGVLRVLVREFSMVVEDYILLERLRSDKVQRKRMLVKEYGRRNLYEYFKKGTEELVSGFDDSYVKDMEHYSELIQLYQDYCFHPMTDNNDVEDDSLEQLMDSLDAYFVLAKYRFAQVLRNRNTMFKIKVEYRFFEMVRENKDNFFINNEIIALYEVLNKMYDDSDEKYFLELKHIFFPIIGNIKRTDCRIIYFMGLNFCTRQINIGKSEYFLEQFDWYSVGLENDLLIENGKMSDSTFNNIINAACYKKEYKWAENFIQNNEKYLDESIKEDALKYSNAILNFEQKKYKEALLLVVNHNFGLIYQLRIRTWRVVIAFELALSDNSFYETLNSHIDSYKKYIQRNTYFSEASVLPFRNHLMITERLVKKMRSNERRVKVKEWLVEIMRKEKKIALKRWLQMKLEEI